MRRRTKALQSTAYHEAGHAVAAYRHGMKVKRLTIVPSGDALGSHQSHAYFTEINLEYDSSPRAQRRAENFALVCFAGPAAQRRFNPTGYRSYHGADDVHQAIGMLIYLAGDNEILTTYAKLMNLQARAFIESAVNWRTVEHLAAVLLDQRTMTGAEVRAAIQEGYRRQLPQGGVIRLLDL